MLLPCEILKMRCLQENPALNSRSGVARADFPDFVSKAWSTGCCSSNHVDMLGSLGAWLKVGVPTLKSACAKRKRK
jgi:hypothetical protein